MDFDWDLILRLFLGGMMGGVIGLEREFRAKEAGLRTHFIVALGSALFMMISQFAFNGRFDAARVAAQVVSGIGFIGAGVIICQKNVVRGVTTAAGLWVAAAIGLACGAGMYWLAGAATLMTVVCLEMMHLVHRYVAEKVVEVTLSSDGETDPLLVLEKVKALKMRAESYSFSGGKIHLSLRLRRKDSLETLRNLVNKLEGITEEEAQEIARIVGMGALKYFILKVDARKNMLFNPEESIDFNGNTGPFIQYTYARIRSILRKAAAAGSTSQTSSTGLTSLSGKEIDLIQKMSEFGAAVEQAGKDYSPSGIANYCYELTKQFNQFYHDYSILGADTEEEKAFRLMLAKNVAKTIKNGMSLLGIEVPERM